MTEVSIVLPSYHEQQNLAALLPQLKAELPKLGVPAEIIVVDTAEPEDGTWDVCRENAVRHVPRKPANSYGDAVRTGIQAAQGRYTIFMDADGSHPPEFIRELYEHAASSDVVIASRYVRGGGTKNTLPLVIMSRVLNFAYSQVLNLKVHDVSNSFKLYRSDLLKSLTLRGEGFDIIQELLFKLRRDNPSVRIREVPFTFEQRRFGESKRETFKFLLGYLRTMFRLRFGR